jgi:hypothetical protein
MLLEISIIVGSVMGGLAIITASAISYVKKIHNNDIAFEQRKRNEIAAEKAEARTKRAGRV